MKRRVVLTAIWFGSLLLALLIVESYFVREVALMGQAVPILTAASRPAMYSELAQIYSPSMLLLGAAWYAKPLKPIPAARVEDWRFRIAVGATLVFNLIVLASIAAHHLSPTQGEVLTAMVQAKQVSLAMAFLIAWPNVHYFGAAPPGVHPAS
jgi:hypothetical protein